MGYMPVDIFRVTVADLIGESPLGLPIACLQPFYRCHALFYHGITKYQNAGSGVATRTVHPFPQVNDVLTVTDYNSAQSSIPCRRKELNTVHLTIVKTHFPILWQYYFEMYPVLEILFSQIPGHMEIFCVLKIFFVIIDSYYKVSDNLFLASNNILTDSLRLKWTPVYLINS